MEQIKGTIWAIGGGKGGVGKSFVASNLACGLGLRGYKVILVDADLAGANIHTLFGISYPARTLNDFMSRKVEAFRDILIPTQVTNLHIVCGASDFIELANPKYSEKQRLIRAISSLDADYIIIDIGAGSSINNLDFFNMADVGIIVTSPAPTAIQNAYGFLKLAVNRRLLHLFHDKPRVRDAISAAMHDDDQNRGMVDIIEMVKEIDEDASWRMMNALIENRYRLVVNSATDTEGEKVSKALAGVAYQYLRIKLPHIGTVAYSHDVELSIRKMIPIVLSNNINTSNSIAGIVKKVIADTKLAQKEVFREKPVKESSVPPPQKMGDDSGTQLCLNDEIDYEGKRLHIQTEDLGSDKAKILSLVFSGGSILFSKSKGYDEIQTGGTQQSVSDKVRWQHKAVIAGIMAGRLRKKIMEEGG